jgi:hypothetical protein
MQNFAATDGVEVVALWDIVKDKLARAQKVLQKLGQQKVPALYDSGERAFEDLSKRDGIDLIVIATPWNWHVPMAVFGMKHGKHVAVEVTAANTLDGCWALVNTSEETRHHCVQLENCRYGYNEMLILNLVRDRFDYMVSMSSPALSLAAYRDGKLPAGDPRRKETYVCGDQNTSLIKTAKGRIITLGHNVSLPEPYDRINLIAGTKGIFRDYPPSIFVEGTGKEEFAPSIPTRRSTSTPSGRLRRGGLVRPRTAQRNVRREGKRAHAVPRLHSWPLEAGTNLDLEL